MTNTHDYPALWRRLAAMLYDSLLVIALSMAYGATVVALNHLLLKLLPEHTQPLISGIYFQTAWLLVIITFFCFFWLKGGQTLGMRAWRLKIIHQDTQQTLKLWQCAGRCLLAPLGLLLFIFSLLRQDRQCLHDLMTQSRVILVSKDN